MSNVDRMVAPRPNGKWANQLITARKATSLHNTPQEAEAAAREALSAKGGGELVIKDASGRVRHTAIIAGRRG
ncbi:MAG: DUF2188 domain-containing protein [Myxococcota bacterium]